MKLYATIQSERATKGQGGEYLILEIKGKRKETIAYMIVEYIPQNESEPFPVITIASTVEVVLEKHNAGFYRVEKRIAELKGEKKTGEQCSKCFAKYSEKTMWCKYCENLK